MRRKDISINVCETDVEELQAMVCELVSLIDDAESRVKAIEGLLKDISIDSISNIDAAYESVKNLSSDLY